MTAPLRRVEVRRPTADFAVDDPARWHYVSAPRLESAQREHDALVAVLVDAGAEVIEHRAELPGMADAIFVFDPVLMTEGGALVLSMGKELRRGEEESLGACLKEAGMPILGWLEGAARAEGGDMFWLDRHTLAVGQGFRTNAEGLAQVRAMLAPLGVEVVSVELPWFDGPEACLHLLSSLSLLADDLAVIHRRYLPVSFCRELEDRGLQLIDVAAEEFVTQAPNVLALAPRHCLMLEGNPITRRRLERAGCQVETYRGEELSLKAEGGPTCLTQPVLRG
nr:N(G),N(G)-dimethylarginine dimethylaminohydrolase-like [Nerophis lumbriciformis]